ncbi:complex I intermediate-associated protein CIA30 [Pleurotus eryngii]|uniref:Complex I intermediate-associated protein CIA30 n=1 Tax=Pleurotus eryngii TaxID=5323 RepID=A0A9P5ZTJ2_PLEER|nr:complex I intermediate-associated protein CIA30 [Pleurotus eryngii]
MSHWSLYVNRSSQVLRDNLAKILLMQGADAPSRAPRSLFTFNTPQDISQFATGSDSDIGGLSTVNFDFIEDETVNGPIGRVNRPTPPSSKNGAQPPVGTARFWGTMSLRIPSTPAANKPRITRSGYAGFRNKARPSLFGNITEDLSSHDYLALRLRPSGNPITRTSYFVNIQTEDGIGMEVWQHRLMFKNQDVPEEELLRVKDGGWEELYIPFNNFVLTHAGEISLQSKPTIRREKVKSIGISILGGNSGVEGRYELGIDEIRAVNDEDVRR